MAVKVDESALFTALQENRVDYATMFAQKMVNGFAAKNDMISMPVVQKMALVREIMGNVTQPGRKGTLNNPDHTVWTYKERVAELKPAKVDLYLDEDMIYKLAISFLANKQLADPRDIHSLAGQQYLMAQLFKKIGKEQAAAIYRGVMGYGYDATNATTQATSMFQGGLNLFDGLGVKLLQGYATSGTGWVGDIPSGNKVSGAASTITASNILAQLTLLQDLIYNNQDLRVAEDEVGGNVFIDPVWFGYIADALDGLTYKPDQVVRPDGQGNYVFKKLSKTKIIKREYMAGAANAFWTTPDNLFYLHQDTEEDIPKMKIHEKDRGIQILIDWECNVDYADGRYIALLK
jgi:hypothetical protein